MLFTHCTLVRAWVQAHVVHTLYISQGMSSGTCSYWARVVHTLYISQGMSSGTCSYWARVVHTLYISQGMSSGTCSYWARVHTLYISQGMSSGMCSCVIHTLYIPLRTWSSRGEDVGAPTGAFGCHRPNGVCVGKLWTMEEEMIMPSDNYALEFHFQRILLLLGWGKNLY